MEFKMCSRCILDYPTDPDIQFGDNGVCNHCLQYDKAEKERLIEMQNLPFLIEKLKKGTVILGLSGGADSSLCLHYLVENGIKPYTYSVDNGYNSKESEENVMRMVEALKVPFYRYSIDKVKFRDLQGAFIKAGLKNIEIPTDHLLFATSYEMAKKYNAKYIISGGNLATESIMPKSFGYQARDLHHMKAVYRKITGYKLIGLPMLSIWGYLYNRFIRGVKVINLLDYYDYNREKAKKLLADKYGWQDYGQKHEESEMTKWMQNYYLPTKFGIDKRKAHFSSLINSGQMTKKEALDELAYAPVYPQLGIEDKILKYTRREYNEYPNQEWLWDLLSKIYSKIK